MLAEELTCDGAEVYPQTVDNVAVWDLGAGNVSNALETTTIVSIPRFPSNKRAKCQLTLRDISVANSDKSDGSPSSQQYETPDMDTTAKNKEKEHQERILRNRVNARQLRIRQKEYLIDLEKRVSDLTAVNTELNATVSLLSNENALMKEQINRIRAYIATRANGLEPSQQT
ncbi:hypothetical protein Pelo_13310 [Pelomyxa schiedti]|nr:hypothetical protein Pelo_13310 [Pelomyxa schiedti]